MSRQPFNPDLIEVPAEQRAEARPGILTVSQLTRMVKNALLDALPAELHVVGEISNLARPASGHAYFTLKDPASELRCVMWRSSVMAMKFRPEDGMEVIATGRIDVYEPRGQYQFYVRRLEPRGVGALELAFRQLCQKLRKAGLFDQQRKRPLPRYPASIAVVTSPTGAAVRDILRTISRRFACVRVMVMPVQVQGAGAAEQIASAIEQLNAQQERLGGIDLMIVGRGGGSLEDLWAFNEEVVAWAIYRSRIPVISAVGHEVDITISDLVADVRAATPTAAAELAVPELAEVLADLSGRRERLGRAAQIATERAANRLAILVQHHFFRDPLAWLRQREQRLDELCSQVRLAVGGRIDQLKRQLHDCQATLARIQPQAYISRCWQRLAELQRRLDQAQWEFMRLGQRQLAVAVQQCLWVAPVAVLADAQANLRQVLPRLQRGLANQIRSSSDRLDWLDKRLQASSYKRVLGRGFSITRLAKKMTIVTDPSQVRPGQRITTETLGGQFDSTVDGPQR